MAIASRKKDNHRRRWWFRSAFNSRVSASRCALYNSEPLFRQALAVPKKPGGPMHCLREPVRALDLDQASEIVDAARAATNMLRHYEHIRLPTPLVCALLHLSLCVERHYTTQNDLTSYSEDNNDC